MRERLRGALRTPPSAAELFLATMIGGGALALANAIDIAITVEAPLWLRLRSHLVDAVLCVGAAAWVAAVVAGLRCLSRARGAVLRRFGWIAIGVASVGAMTFVLGRQLLRQANVPFDSELRHVLVVVYVSLCAAAVPAAYLVAATLGRMGTRFVILCGALGAGGIATGHLILRDDYPGVHTAIGWVSATFFGAALSPWLAAKLHRYARAYARAALASAWFALALLIPPDNAVRCALFEQPGAVVPWVLGRLWWSPPEVRVEAKAPLVQRVSPRTFEEARRGLTDDSVVVLISVDAMRADVIASGAYDEALPTLSRLRENGVFFSRAIAPGSQTSVSLTSLFSGRYFSQLRWGYYGRGRSRYHYAAADAQVRFPRLLSDAGVKTTSVLPLVFLAGAYGVARGFESETMATSGRGHAEAARVMTPLIEAIRTEPGPAFFYAHLTEPHEPYDRATKKGSPFERYVAEIALVDRWLARLLRRLKRRRDAYLIVTADHGEAFGEHGRYFHTKSLYDEMVAVPLILWGPGLARRRIEREVSLIDLGPTIMHLFGLPAPEGSMGRSLLPLARGVTDDHPSLVVAEGRLQHAYWRADGIKVIEDTERKTVEVYDLRADPAETDNLFGRDPRAESAVAELRAFFAREALDYDIPFKP